MPQKNTEEHRRRGGLEWETVIGENWLNKIGVFVLIVGIALFLGYSVTQLGPAGRVVVGFAVSGGLLLGGALFERRPRFRIFGRGLLGGGWAGLYFTTYAMHGLAASRVIDDPLAASALLVAVATGLIVHSLRYRSQVVTGLAYFIAFVTLAMSPATTFSLAAAVPLAASLLIVARRFGWTPMAAVGLVTTYGTYVMTTGGLQASGGDLLRQQAVLATYWLLFEAFDLLAARTDREEPARGLLFPLNACGAIGASLLQWTAAPPAALGTFFATAAAAYVASAIARACLRRPFAPSANGEDGKSGEASYRLAATVAAALVVPAIVLRFSGIQATLAFLLAGELLYLSGLQFGDRYLRGLASAMFVIPFTRWLALDLPDAGSIGFAGWTLHRATPGVLITATVLYLDRVLIGRRGSELLPSERCLRAAASFLLAIVVAVEVPHARLGGSWLVLAIALFEVGLRKRLGEFRLHAYAAAIAAFGAVALIDISGARADHWTTLAFDAAIVYLWVVRLATVAADALRPDEGVLWARVCAWAGAVILVTLCWTLAPAAYLGIVCLLLAFVLFEAGMWALSRTRGRGASVLSAIGYELRMHAYAVSLIAIPKLAIDALPAVVEPVRLLLTVGTGTILLWAGFVRAATLDASLSESERTLVSDAASACATAFTGILMWQLLPPQAVAAGWGLMGFLLIDRGVARRLGSLRLYGHIAVALTLGRIVLTNLTDTGATFGLSHRILVVGPAIALVYYLAGWLRQRAAVDSIGRVERQLPRAYLHAGTALLVLLVGFECSRAAAAAGWGLVAVGLLALGRIVRSDHLRWQSYPIAVLACVRAFAWIDGPDALSLRLTNAGLVVASLYAAQALAPRPRATRARRLTAVLDRHARPILSLMATVLLATVLSNELSAAALTIGWSVQGTALLAAGFLTRDRTLRTSGLVLLAVCIAKAFAYDVRMLDTLARILSFIVLGILLLLTSWVYARFNERVKRYL